MFSREVNIGGIILGGQHPVRIQSMTNTNTLDTEATLAQCLALARAGCDLVRVATPGMKEARNLKYIKKKLIEQGCTVPIIADVHFKPKVAEYCATFVEKVRINPGNYVDKKNFKQLTYSDTEYSEELERIGERLLPLITICKQNGTALRIGTNHGSLSDRILSRYGDTPKGMVEATMEFLRLFAAHDFHNIVVSLKASNPLIMIKANQLLVHQMQKEKLLFPVHLGVTEAGMDEAGRIKSALGIGNLLEKGIGDTIRVSLTESPVNEVPFAKKIVNLYGHPKKKMNTQPQDLSKSSKVILSSFFKELMLPHYPTVALKVKDSPVKQLFYKETMPDFITEDNFLVRTVNDGGTTNSEKAAKYPFYNYSSFMGETKQPKSLVFVECSADSFTNALFLKKVKEYPRLCFIYEGSINKEFYKVRLALQKEKTPHGFLLKLNVQDGDTEEWLIKNTIDLSRVLWDNLIDGVFMEVSAAKAPQVLNIIYGILQAARCRISKTEFISCPSCGRTTFDIEAALRKVMSQTAHLKGLKIGVMGCIVNGPGEMADADYGYVGNANGNVNLYRGQTAIKKNIPQDKALEELIQLIKSDGRWVV